MKSLYSLSGPESTSATNNQTYQHELTTNHKRNKPFSQSRLFISIYLSLCLFIFFNVRFRPIAVIKVSLNMRNSQAIRWNGALFIA